MNPHHPHAPHHRPQRRRPLETADDRLSASLSLLSLSSLPIYQLPPEILLNIIDRLTVDDYPALIPSLWHLLRRHGIAPSFPTLRLKQILIWPRMGFYDTYQHATSANPEVYHRGCCCAGQGGGSSSGSSNHTHVSEAFIPRQMRPPILHRLSPSRESFWHENFTDVRSRLRGGFQKLPREIQEMVLEAREGRRGSTHLGRKLLEPGDKVNLVLACWRFSDGEVEWMTHEEV